LINLAAFLTMISHSEGTDRVPDPYRCCFGFDHTIQSFADHPAITGEWDGETFALKTTGQLIKSTAAGRYQINKPTWITYRVKLRLTNFMPLSQDAAAIGMIKDKGALNLVNDGRVSEAIDLCHPIWASLPGSLSGQPQKTMAQLLQAYTMAGGGFSNG
jgi:muramidase (phage lysozyme)